MNKIQDTNFVLILFIILSIAQGILILKQYNKISLLEDSAQIYHNYIIHAEKLNSYNIKLSNYDVDLKNVVLKYKTQEYKTISLGDLPALDFGAKVTDDNRESHVIRYHIDDMASPICFEITGVRGDGTIFEGKVSGFHIREDNETFETFIPEDGKELRYH